MILTPTKFVGLSLQIVTEVDMKIQDYIQGILTAVI